MTSNALRHTYWVLILSLGMAGGCNSGGDESTLAAIESHQPHGTHGGHTAKMSEDADFEIELTLDEKRRRMVLYVQESGGRKPYPLATDSLGGQFEADGQNIKVTFAADPRPSDPKGSASRFALALDSLPQQLRASDQFVLRLYYAADGKTITASIPHKNDHAHEYHHD